MVRQAVAQKYAAKEPNNQIVERGGNFIINGSRGSKFVLGTSIGLVDISITTGTVKSFSGDDMQVVPPPSSTQEDFDIVMADFIEVFKDTVNEAYRLRQKSPPDETMLIRPPKVGANGKEIGRRSDLGFGGLETPADLAGKIEIEKPDVKFADIGGQKEAKREIQGLLLLSKTRVCIKNGALNRLRALYCMVHPERAKR